MANKPLTITSWTWEKEDNYHQLHRDRAIVVEQLSEALTATLHIKIPLEVASALITKADSVRRFLEPFDPVAKK